MAKGRHGWLAVGTHAKRRVFHVLIWSEAVSAVVGNSCESVSARHLAFEVREDALDLVLIHQRGQFATAGCVEHGLQIVPDALEAPGFRIRNHERIDPEFLTGTLLV